MVDVIKAPNFEEMDEEKLRAYAKHMRIPVKTSATRDQLLAAITERQSKRVAPTLADGDSEVKPGYAKIVIHQDPTPGSKQIPVYLNANGYECTIPRGVEVIVPRRVVRTLKDAKVNRRQQTTVQDANGREIFAETVVVVPSYPYTVLEEVPGPEPLTAAELSKLKSYGPRERYAYQFGHWPNPARRWVAQRR